MTDLDGEIEKLRAEARHRLDGERELEEKLAGYERELRAPRETETETENENENENENEVAKPKPPSAVQSSLTAQVAEAKAKEAAAKVGSFSTPKLVVLLAVIVFGGWIINNLIGPLVALATLLIICLLGYRFLRWLTTSDPDDDEPS